MVESNWVDTVSKTPYYILVAWAGRMTFWSATSVCVTRLVKYYRGNTKRSYPCSS